MGYLSPQCQLALKDSFRLIHIKAKHLLVRRKQPADKAWYVYSGILKGFYQTRFTHQKIFAFWHDDEVIGNGTELFKQLRYPYSIWPITDCTLLEISYANIIDLLNQFPECHKINRLLLIETHEKAQERIRILLKKGHNRMEYEQFCLLHPYHHHLSDMDIASYMGISKSRLSNIKKGR